MLHLPSLGMVISSLTIKITEWLFTIQLNGITSISQLLQVVQPVLPLRVHLQPVLAQVHQARHQVAQVLQPVQQQHFDESIKKSYKRSRNKRHLDL